MTTQGRSIYKDEVKERGVEGRGTLLETGDLGNKSYSTRIYEPILSFF
jgi:hypothetical protein